VDAKRRCFARTKRDRELAKQLARTVGSVRTRRLVVTDIKFIRTPRHWKRAELRLLGRLSDTDIARRTGRFMASVRNKRIQLGIARYAPKR